MKNIFILSTVILVSIFTLSFCVSETSKTETEIKVKVSKSPTEWKKELTKQQYYVLREKGTEQAFTGSYWNNKESGTYYCAGCSNVLFSSDTKFKSGTGWPSYYQAATDTSIVEVKDNSHGWNRVEVICAKCDGHLGHVFEDGPNPTGLRYCINSVSLIFKEK